MSAEVVDLTLSDSEPVAPEPSPGAGAKRKRAIPGKRVTAAASGAAAASGPASPAEVIELDDDGAPCAVCGGGGAAGGLEEDEGPLTKAAEGDGDAARHAAVCRASAGCRHVACAACLRAAVSGPLAAPPGALHAFRLACPAPRCAAPLAHAALAAALPAASLRSAQRWLAASLDAAAAAPAAATSPPNCPACGALQPAARGKASKDATKDATSARPCAACGASFALCASCGVAHAAGASAPRHACAPPRRAALQLAAALGAVRAAHCAPGGAGGAGGAAAKRGKAKKAAAAPASGAGTGYGGNAGPSSKTVNAARAKAQAQAAAADTAMTAALDDAAAALDALRPHLPLSAAAVAAVVAGGLAPALLALLRGASLFDAAARGAVLRAALRAIAAAAAMPPLLPLLLDAGAAAAPVSAPGASLAGETAAGGGDDGGDGDDDAGGGSVADALAELAEQAAAVLAASAGSRGEDEAAALARQVADAAESLAVRRRAARLTGGAAGARRRRRAAAAAAGGDTGKAAAAAEVDYTAVMSPQCFDSHALAATHYFRREFPSAASSAGEAGRQRMRRIVREAAAMRAGLPCAWGSVVAVRVDESRADVMQALIVPHRDTPYAGGVFVFDILLPMEYPNAPPKVVILTTGGGRVRFNPNLYADGKVCLSLLGTWKGPGWDPQTSTLLQVLISIQSLIFVEKPWFNEPGYERSAGTPQGESQSAAYNAQVRADTLGVALLPALRSPPPAFHAFLVQHFRRKHGELREQLREWAADARRQLRGPHAASARQLLAAADEAEDELQRYAPGAVSGPVDTITLL